MADHSKRGRRFVTVLDLDRSRVTLLEAWEHAILVLSDGSRGVLEIASMLAGGIEGEPVTPGAVRRCLKFFERQELIEPAGLCSSPALPPAGPQTLAGLQLAYREWHRDPVRTGQILAGFLDPPFVRLDGSAPVGLDPTVALPEDDELEPKPVAVGTTLVLGDGQSAFSQARALRSLLDGGASRDAPTQVGALAEDESDDELLELDDVAELLAAVDGDFAAIGEEAPVHKPPPVGRAIAGEAEIPAARDRRKPSTKVQMKSPGAPVVRLPASVATEVEDAREATRTMRPAPIPEAALNPTMVGIVAPDAAEPVLLAPPRRGSSEGPEPRTVSEAPRVRRASVRPSLIERGEGSHPRPLPPELRDEEEPTTSSSMAHVHARARVVFERLQKAGLKARAFAEEDDEGEGPGPRRRRSHSGARAFEQALETLTSGDLEQALGHFRALAERTPDSGRLAAFIEAIEAAIRETADDASTKLETTQRILAGFEAAVEESVIAGRCPRCFAALEAGATECASCTFAVV